jgi:hypothetical protein
MPVAGSIVNPAGKAPSEIDQTNVPEIVPANDMEKL